MDLEKEKMKVWHEMKALNDLTLKENRAFTSEEQLKWDRLDSEFDSLEERFLATPKNQAIKPYPQIDDYNNRSNAMDYETADNGYRFNPNGTSQRDIFNRWLRDPKEPLLQNEYRALQADNDVKGGFMVVPTMVTDEILSAVKNDVFIRNLARIFPCDESDSIGSPFLDADISDPDWVGEITEASQDTDMSIERRDLHPHRCTKFIKVSRKLLRLARANPETFLKDRIQYKLSVTEENTFLNGNGVQQPLGVFTVSNMGISTDRDVSEGNTSSAIKADGLINCLYSLKAQYIRSPNCRWIFHRDAIKQIRKLKTGSGEYLWEPGIAGNRPATILDVPYVMSEYAPNTFSANQYVGICGDLSFYGVAESGVVEILNLVEKYALTDQVAFLINHYCDGMPLLEEAFARVKLGS